MRARNAEKRCESVAEIGHRVVVVKQEKRERERGRMDRRGRFWGVKGGTAVNGIP